MTGAYSTVSCSLSEEPGCLFSFKLVCMRLTETSSYVPLLSMGSDSGLIVNFGLSEELSKVNSSPKSLLKEKLFWIFICGSLES